MRQLLCLQELSSEQQKKITAAAPGWNVIFAKAKELEPSVIAQSEIVLGWSKIVAEQGLAANSKLRWVQVTSAGVDFLPLPLLKQHDVLLTNASGMHPKQMTETTLAMMLAFTRNVHTAIRNQTQNKWERSEHYTELDGKTVGIIGLGRIGEHTARIAKAFGMTVLGVRRSGLPSPHVDRMYSLRGLDEVLAESDFVVNILPLTEESHHLFDEKRFSLMKPTAYFINVGRGPSVRTDALLEALRLKRIAGAGLDVFEEEPLPPDHPLWEMDNVIITPHIGGNTDRYTDLALDVFLANFAAYEKGDRALPTLVDYETSY